MKKIILSALAIGSMCAFSGTGVLAGPNEETAARLAALEKENAMMRRENAALLDNRSLREKNTTLKLSGEQQSAGAVAVASDPKRSWLDSLAADLPLTRKAPVYDAPGQFSLWTEGGAIWSGGDPVSSNYSLLNLATLNTIPGTFGLTPKLGWEAAVGFDYRFAGSPWHVSGQFRYGEGGKTSGTASTSGNLDPALLALIGGPFAGATIGGSQTDAARYKETHWITDLAVGRDVMGNGPDALQLKGGLRVAEFVARTNTSSDSAFFANFPVPIVIGGGFPPIGAASISTSSVTDARNSFLGAGPLIGIQGSVPFAGNWSFDYLGDAAVLFGTQRSVSTNTNTIAATPAVLGLLLGGLGGGNNIATTTTERFATVFSADIQVGLSYWITQNVKVGASYRLDALINVQNQELAAVGNITPDRYTHGPRLTVTGRF